MGKSTFKVYKDKVIASIEIIGDAEIELEDALNKLNNSDGCNIQLYNGTSLSVEDYLCISSKHKLQFIGERMHDGTTAEIDVNCKNNVISAGKTHKSYNKELIQVEMTKFSDIIQLVINKGIENMEHMQAEITVDLLKDRVEKIYKVGWVKREIESNYILKHMIVRDT